MYYRIQGFQKYVAMSLDTAFPLVLLLNTVVISCDISMRVAKRAVKDWTIRDHMKHWNSLSGLQQAKQSYRVPLPTERRSC
jgi:hypothetical protein